MGSTSTVQVLPSKGARNMANLKNARFRKIAILIITLALSFGLIALSGQAQTGTSKTTQKESDITKPARQPGIKRTDLQRHDLSADGREVIQVRVDFDPGYVAPRHTHPGEEIIYVIEGTLEYEIGG